MVVKSYSLTSLVETFLISREAAGLTPRAREFYEQQLRYFLNYVGEGAALDHLTPETLEAYLAKRQKEVKPRSVHAAWRAIRTFCRWLDSRKGRYGEWTNPIPQVVGPRLPREKAPAVDRDSLKAMVKACEGHSFFDDRDRAILLVLASSGLRAQECLHLKQGDVDLKTGAVQVARGKGGAGRMTIISPEARLALADYLSHLVERDAAKPLWWGTRGALTYSGLAEALARRAKKAGVPWNGLHAFRRRWASDLAPRLGAHVVQALGGWENIASMKPYIQLSREDLLDAYENGVTKRR